MRALRLKYVKFSPTWLLHLHIKSSHLKLGYKELTRMQLKMEIQKYNPSRSCSIYIHHVQCRALYQAVQSSSACNFISLMVSYGYMNL